jgi:hypothetical protein
MNLKSNRKISLILIAVPAKKKKIMINSLKNSRKAMKGKPVMKKLTNKSLQIIKILLQNR